MVTSLGWAGNPAKAAGSKGRSNAVLVEIHIIADGSEVGPLEGRKSEEM